MALATLPSADTLRQLLCYDAETGALYWLPRPENMFETGDNPNRIWKIWNARYAGTRADGVRGPNGYSIVTIFDQRNLAHQVVWRLVYGRDAVGVIDHINGNRRDNRLSNLRDVSQKENCRNLGVRSDNVSGISGIWQKDPKAWGARWMVVCSENSKIIRKKSFKCIGQAIKYRAMDLRSRGFTATHGIRPAMMGGGRLS